MDDIGRTIGVNGGISEPMFKFKKTSKIKKTVNVSFGSLYEKIKLMKIANLIKQGFSKFDVVLSCGCCRRPVFFKSVEDIELELSKHGLIESADIIDGTGTLIKHVDTFAGVLAKGEKTPLIYTLKKGSKERIEWIKDNNCIGIHADDWEDEYKLLWKLSFDYILPKKYVVFLYNGNLNEVCLSGN